MKVNCYTMDPGCLSGAFACWLNVFQQLCSARLKLSPVRPKVSDATARSYLTWSLTLCVCTINTMPHELYSWEGGGRTGKKEEKKVFVTQTYLLNGEKKPLRMVRVMSVNVRFESWFMGELPATHRLSGGREQQGSQYNSTGVYDWSESIIIHLDSLLSKPCSSLNHESRNERKWTLSSTLSAELKWTYMLQSTLFMMANIRVALHIPCEKICFRKMYGVQIEEGVFISLLKSFLSL